MDDQNQTNQPLVPGTTPVVPSVPEDITPVAPVVAPAMEPITPPTPWNSPAEPVSMPTPSIEPAPAAEEPVMPVGKPKKKILPIVGGVLALLLVVGVAGAAYYVSNQLSTRQAVAPTAPESKPMAGVLACDNITHVGKPCLTDLGLLGYCTVVPPKNVEFACIPNANQPGGECEGEPKNCGGSYCVTNICVQSCTDVGGECYIGATGCTDCGTGGGGGGGGSTACLWDNRTCTTDSQCYTGYAAGEPCYNVICSATTNKCVSTGGGSCPETGTFTYGTYPNNLEYCKYRASSLYGGDKNCESQSCSPYKYGCGVYCFDTACGADACGEHVIYPACGDANNPKDDPASKQITFSKAGKVTLFTRNMAGTVTLTGPKTVTITSNDGGAAVRQPTTFNVNANETYTIKVVLQNEQHEQPSDSYGWIKNKTANICGPVRTPGAPLDAKGNPTGKCGVDTDISQLLSIIDTGTYDITGISAGGTVANIQCWADRLKTDATQDYDFNDFTLVFGYEDTAAISACTDLRIYKQVEADEDASELTATQLNNLKVGDVLTFQMSTSTDNLKGQFGVKIGTADYIWLAGTIDAANKKLVKSAPYTITTEGAYLFQSQVSETPTSTTWVDLATSTCQASGTVSTTTQVGACMSMNIYKKVGDEYQMMFLSDEELQKLKIGDLLKFSVLANMSGLRARFRVSIGDVPGAWLDGTVDTNNPKLFLYTDYPVGAAGTYRFESEVSTAP